MAKISIITICYNEPNLEKTCESIVNQTFQDFEWIVVDGGSNQETQEIWNKYKHRINKFISEPDNGRYDAMNKGIHLASGEYLNFMNAGDYFKDKNVLQKVIDYKLDKDIVFGNILISKKIGFYKIQNFPDVVDELFLFSNSLPHQASFIKKDLFDKYGVYSEDYTIVSDWAKWFVFIFQHNCSYKHINLVCCVYNLEGISAKNRKLAEKERKIVLSSFFSENKLKELASMQKIHYTFLEHLFSIKNSIDRKEKIISIFGIKIRVLRHKPFKRNKNKKYIVINGNCVMQFIAYFLKTNRDFRKQYDIELLKPVFLVEKEDVQELQTKVAECDIFITQPITGEKYKALGIDTETMQSLMKDSAKTIKIPVPYFTGYFPEQFYLHDKNGYVVSECEGLPSPYNNKIILYGFINNLKPNEVLKILNNENNMNNISQSAQDSIDELKKREKDLDFGISGFIEKNYKKHRLFWTINHPANYLIRYIADEILRILGIQKHWYNFWGLTKKQKKEFLYKPFATPIIKSVYKELQLKKGMINAKYTLKFVSNSYNYYHNHSDLVEINKEYVENIL